MFFFVMFLNFSLLFSICLIFFIFLIFPVFFFLACVSFYFSFSEERCGPRNARHGRS